MFPTWVGVVTAISLAVIALAVLAVAAAIAGATFGVRAVLDQLRSHTGPALDDVRHAIGTIRAEVDDLAGTSRELRGRVLKAADAAEARLAQLDSVANTVQEEVQSAAQDIGATIRTLRRGASLLDWGRRALKTGRGRRKR